jgi:serine protease Do
VQPGDPAARAGIQQGDVIVRVGGQQVTPDQTVSYLIANTQVGSRVPVEIVRDGRRQTVTVTPAQRPSEEALAKAAGGGSGDDATGGNAPATGPATRALGLSLQPLSPQLIQTLSLPAGTHGVVITAVDSSSDASDKGLRRGDVIISVNRALVTTPAQVTAAVAAARAAGRNSVLLLVKRGAAPEAFIGVDIAQR